MSAVTTNPFAPSRGLFPVTKKPSESHESKAVFVDLVYRHLDSDAFKNVAEFEQWFKTLVPRVVSDFGDDPKVGLGLISLAFPHGGMMHFMRWVTMKFTTTKSPEEAAAAAAEAAAEDERAPPVPNSLSESSQFGEEPESDPDCVVFENCTPEEALLALWNETRYLGFGYLQKDGSPPTLEECKEELNRDYVDYLKGKPIKTNFRKFPVLFRCAYEENAGKGKMQNAANILRAKKISASKASASGGAGEGEIQPQKEPELDFITEFKFEEDTKSIEFRCWVEGGKIRVKLLHIDTKYENSIATMKIPEAGEPGFGMPIKMLAHRVLEKAIPAIMENEKEAIIKYVKA